MPTCWCYVRSMTLTLVVGWPIDRLNFLFIAKQKMRNQRICQAVVYTFNINRELENSWEHLARLFNCVSANNVTHTLIQIHSAVREAYQSTIGQRTLTSNFRLHLNPNFRESGLHTYTRLLKINHRLYFKLSIHWKDKKNAKAELV